MLVVKISINPFKPKKIKILLAPQNSTKQTLIAINELLSQLQFSSKFEKL